MNTELDTVLASQPPIVSKALPADKKKRKPAAKKVAAKKAPAKKVAAKKITMSLKTGKVAVKKVEAAGKTKAQHARELYAKMTKAGKERKAVIEAFINTVGLTPAGANTYLSNIRRQHSK